jgi:hypothetical protein
MTAVVTWADELITWLPVPRNGIVVILLDPRSVLPPDVLAGWEWHDAATAWDVRRIYEKHIRGRPSTAPPALIHSTDPAIDRADRLPWDIAQLPVAIVDPRIPVQVIDALSDLPRQLVTEVCDAIRAGLPAGPLIASRMLGVTLPAPDAATELLVAARAHAAGLSAATRALIQPHLTTSEARDAIDRPGSGGPLAAAWRDWCDNGVRSKHHAVFSGCGPTLLSLVDAGLLPSPSEPGPGLPAWLSAAKGLADPTPIVEALLHERPAVPPSDFQGWVEVATWWSRVRWTCALGSVNPVVVDAAWHEWTQLDQHFQAWLTANYASELGRHYLPPRTVDKIAPFLAYQLRKRNRPQVLVVIDGMGIAQWHQIRSIAQAVEADRYLVMAALPTITRVSRQAIFAGAPPRAFAATISSPAEERLWRQFWRNQDIPDTQVEFIPTDGRTVPPVPPTARAIGIVVNNVDEAMHAAGSYDDVGFRDLVARFAQTDFLPQLMALASERGWDLWFTADHGNLSCRGLPGRVPHEGLRVTSRGKRVWTYATAELRASANVPGLPWDPPGYPQEAGYPLFALGRFCYERNAVLVSHGGLSFDEVFVPLVRVQT